MTGTRQALLGAAIELLDEGGPAAVTMREVGRRAEVSHNAPYKHFADKEHLLAEIAAAELRETATLLGQHGDDIAAAMRAVIELSLRRPQRFRLVYGPWRSAPGELAEAAASAWGALIGAVERAIRAGVLPPGEPARIANLLRALAHGAVELELGDHLAKSGDDADPAGLVDDLLSRLRG
ncbi:TetR/AcrR family transcriptional regulator [Microbacterium paludicola]|uniref:TetR/AcrR family transcriptional regulator n=1 Tax=Microbacterium paludicola TaxID=300019 RepID=UPI0031DBD5D7